jgi:hypothetical protein
MQQATQNNRHFRADTPAFLIRELINVGLPLDQSVFEGICAHLLGNRPMVEKLASPQASS